MWDESIRVSLSTEIDDTYYCWEFTVGSEEKILDIGISVNGLPVCRELNITGLDVGGEESFDEENIRCLVTSYGGE